MEYTELFAKFLEGIIHSFGYETKKDDVSKGLITLEFERKSPEDITLKKTNEKRAKNV
jgi:hypothetical protein